MIFTNRVKSIVREDIIPEIVDNLLNDNFITYRYVGTGKKFSSYSAIKAIKIAKNAQGGSFSHMDTLDTGTAETRVKMEFEPKGYSKPIAIPGLEEAVNDTEAQIVSLIRAETDSTVMDMLDDLGDIFYADGTGNGGKDFEGFANLIDDSTVAGTIGGLSRTTYTMLRGTRQNFSGTLTLAKLATFFSSISGGSSAKQRPTLFQSSETEFDLYEQLLTPTQRANYDTNGLPRVTRTSKGAIRASEQTGNAGYTSLIYRGVPWVADEKAPTTNIWGVNENYIDWLGLRHPRLTTVNMGDSHDGVYSDMPTKDTGLQYRDFMDSFNQLAMVAHAFLLGNMVTFQPRRHGRGINVNGV